jgi:hypothetical protein
MLQHRGHRVCHFIASGSGCISQEQGGLWRIDGICIRIGASLEFGSGWLWRPIKA